MKDLVVDGETKTDRSELNSTTGYYELGIDVGAISIKVILLENGKNVVGSVIRPTYMEPNKLVEGMVTFLLEENSLSRDRISHSVATGQGRKSIWLADMARTEITAFAKGAYFLYPDVRIAVDIGGQGVRVMKIGEMGIVTDFRTNDKCSSGTGCFMDTMAVALEIGIDKMGELSLDSLRPETISTTCTVFAESEVVSLVAKGKNKEDIVAGLNSMVAKKIAALINATRSHGPVFLGGGVARNQGITGKLKEEIGREVFVPQQPQLVGALGAALLAPKPENEDDGELKKSRGNEMDGEDDDEVAPGSSIFKKLRFRGRRR